MKEISRFFNENLDKNRFLKSSEKIETNNNLIRELLDENILLKSKAKNKDEVFKEILKISNELNRKNNLFLDSIIKREDMGSTSVYTGISIPHCDSKYVNKSQLGIITLDKPIKLWKSKTNDELISTLINWRDDYDRK